MFVANKTFVSCGNQFSFFCLDYPTPTLINSARPFLVYEVFSMFIQFSVIFVIKKTSSKMREQFIPELTVLTAEVLIGLPFMSEQLRLLNVHVKSVYCLA